MDAREDAALVGLARASRHHVRIDVDRVARVGHEYRALAAEDLLDVAAVLFAAVRDEDLVARELDTPGCEVALEDGLDEEVVAVLGSVAVGLLQLVFDGRVHGPADGRSQGESDVADPEPNHTCIGMCLREGAYTPYDLGEEIAGDELAVVLVDLRHQRGASASRIVRSGPGCPSGRNG